MYTAMLRTKKMLTMMIGIQKITCGSWVTNSLSISGLITRANSVMHAASTTIAIIVTATTVRNGCSRPSRRRYTAASEPCICGLSATIRRRRRGRRGDREMGEAEPAERIHRGHHRLVRGMAVGPQYHWAIVVGARDRCDGALEGRLVVAQDAVVADEEVAFSIDHDHQRIRGRRARLVTGLGQRNLEAPLLHEGRGQHEKHQQRQQHVDEADDVDFEIVAAATGDAHYSSVSPRPAPCAEPRPWAAARAHGSRPAPAGPPTAHPEARSPVSPFPPRSPAPANGNSGAVHTPESPPPGRPPCTPAPRRCRLPSSSDRRRRKPSPRGTSGSGRIPCRAIRAAVQSARWCRAC